MKSRDIGPGTKEILEFGLRRHHLRVVELTPEVRTSIGLDPRIHALWSPGDDARVKKRIAGHAQSANDKIRLNNGSPHLDRSMDAVFVSDFNDSHILPHQRAWAYSRLQHELAHAFFQHQLDQHAETLLNLLPASHFGREGDHYWMNSQIFDFLHESFAYKMGYQANLEYQDFSGSWYRFISTVHTSASGQTIKRNLTKDNLHQEVQSLVLLVYGIQDPVVLSLVQARILDQIISVIWPNGGQ